MKWVIKSADSAQADLLAASLPANSALRLNDARAARTLAHLLVTRGISEPEAAERFLTPSLAHLHSPYLMTGMKAAVERIEAAIERKESILIYGDYDVDGTTAIVILKTAIELCGGSADFHVPHRIRDGYDMRDDVIECAAASGIHLIISVDMGIRAFAPADTARRLGVDLIVRSSSARAGWRTSRAGCPQSQSTRVRLSLQIVVRSGSRVQAGPRPDGTKAPTEGSGAHADVIHKSGGDSDHCRRCATDRRKPCLRQTWTGRSAIASESRAQGFAGSCATWQTPPDLRRGRIPHCAAHQRRRAYGCGPRCHRTVQRERTRPRPRDRQPPRSAQRGTAGGGTPYPGSDPIPLRARARAARCFLRGDRWRWLAPWGHWHHRHTRGGTLRPAGAGGLPQWRRGPELGPFHPRIPSAERARVLRRLVYPFRRTRARCRLLSSRVTSA